MFKPGFYERGALPLDIQVGEPHGIRAFDVDERGRLHSVVSHHIWKPGINEARKDYGGFHGFYSFHDGDDEYESKTRITGVIKNSGEVFVGQNGFRSEKAEIVAIVMPKILNFELSRLDKWFRRNITIKTYRYRNETEWEPKMKWGLLMTALLVIPVVLFLPLALSVSPWSLFGFLMYPAAIYMFIRSYWVVDTEKHRTNPSNFIKGAGLIKHAYGDNIQYFTSRRKMLKAFPLYKIQPEVPKALTLDPKDDSYWT